MPVPPVPTSLERAAGWAWRLLAVAALALAVLLLLYSLSVIVLPTIVAITIAPAFAPLVGALRARGMSRPAAAVALLAGLTLLAILIAIVAASVATQYDELSSSVREGTEVLLARLEEEPFNLSLDDVSELNASLSDSWGAVSGYLLSGVSTGVEFLTGLVLAVAVLYFILRDGRAFWEWIVRRAPEELRPGLDEAGRRAWVVLGGYVRGTALIAAIDATLIGLGLWVLGVPVPFALAVLVFLGAFVPFVGAFISGLVAVLVAFADGGWKVGLAALALVVAVQLLEGNFLQPIIQSRTVLLHPAVILLAVAAGASLFGILGAYLAVPVTAVGFAAASAFAGDGDVTPAAEEEPGAAGPSGS